MNSKRKFLVILSIAFAFPFVNYSVISLAARKNIFNSIADLPAFNNVLVFGAGMNYPSDNPNMSFNSRMDAAEKAAKRPLTKRIILSGSVNKNENEAFAMKMELIRRGVDPALLITDSSGKNTFQSILNYKKEFGNEGVILISSKAHLERALCYSRQESIACCGYSTLFSHNNFMREVIARLKTTFEMLR